MIILKALKPDALADAKLGLHEKARGFDRDVTLDAFELLADEESVENGHPVLVNTPVFSTAPGPATSIIQ